MKQKLKNTIKNIPKTQQAGLILIIGVVMVIGGSYVPQVAANLQEQINELSEKNEKKEQARGSLEEEAVSLEDKIERLQKQINGLQVQINDNRAQIKKLRNEIKEVEKELEQQRGLLGQNIKAMYIEGQMTTLEMLASSKNISEFVDKQQYRNAVKDKIKVTLDRITELRHELRGQEERLEKRLEDQEEMQMQLAAQRNQNNNLLSLNVNQRNQLDSEIKENSARIAELRRQQVIENARFISGTVGTSSVCGGGYPGSTKGPFGTWGCDHPISNTIDNWGMYNRQCVSYTAFKVAASGRHMPYWGGHGNANQWPANARAAGIPVNRTPKVGSIAVSMAGFYGHVMYVEHVYNDGTILISQYNAAWDGAYSEARISVGSLQFIHFP